MLVLLKTTSSIHPFVLGYINLAVCWSMLLGVAVGTPLFFSSCDKLWKSWLQRDVYDSCSKAGGPLQGCGGAQLMVSWHGWPLVGPLS